MSPSVRPFPATGGDLLLEARDLGRRHPAGTAWLYQGIDIRIESGDRTALVGPTGSGKSLILRALALLDSTDRGEITWRGTPISDVQVPEIRGHVLYLQQRSPVIEGTVEDNLKLSFTFVLRKEMSYPRHRAEELLEKLGRDSSFLSSRTSNLSGGERQLVALLRALLAEPSILLLDEPSAALDPETTASLESLVGTWHSEAPRERAYVWVSHDPIQAERVADRVLALEDGRMVETR